MGRMVRKQVVLSERLERALADKATELGVSQSEVVRLAVERFIEDLERDRRMRAWEGFERLADEAIARGVGSGGRKWTREELHERPGRH
ncbi:MAG: hypothetical protein C0418_04000 [Coriobacteriaceae bacterium]|nr:hypothetical protein [Coriobacteriaceae bacterium]